MPLKVGVLLDNLLVPLDQALKLTAQWGAECFQVFITKGPMLAANMPASARADFVKRYQDLGLTLSATCGDFGANFADAEMMKQKEPLLNQAIAQSAELGTAVMTTHIGALGEDEASAEAMAAALKRLGDRAVDAGVTLATETGLESGQSLREIIQRADTAGVAVNFDPANLVMSGFDHLQSVRDLADLIVHTHAKDGVRDADGKAREVPLGEGAVDYPKYVALLKELGYDGAYVIEREGGDDRTGDVQRAVEFLKGL